MGVHIKVYMSNETVESLNEQIQNAFERECEAGGMEIALAKAVTRKESCDYIFAYRVDYKVLKEQSWYVKTLDPDQIGKKEFYASYGLMQVLYGNAKHMKLIGKTNSPLKLFEPMLNIESGCRVLYNFLRRYKGNIPDAIAAYNQGSNRKDSKGRYRNRKYVQQVYKRYVKLGGEQRGHKIK